MKIREKFSGQTPFIQPSFDENPVQFTKKKNPNDMTPNNGATRFGLTNMLRHRGYTMIGEGSYGNAYTHPDQPGLVFKTFANDRGWTKFWSMAKSTDNPHFPEVAKLGRFSFMGFSFIGTWVEKLTPFSFTDASDSKIINDVRGNISDPQQFPLDKTYDVWPRFPEAIDMIRKVLSIKIKRTVSFNNGHSERLSLPAYNEDLHEGNMMWRGDVPVFTDPLEE